MLNIHSPCDLPADDRATGDSAPAPKRQRRSSKRRANKICKLELGLETACARVGGKVGLSASMLRQITGFSKSAIGRHYVKLEARGWKIVRGRGRALTTFEPPMPKWDATPEATPEAAPKWDATPVETPNWDANEPVAPAEASVPVSASCVPPEAPFASQFASPQTPLVNNYPTKQPASLESLAARELAGREVVACETRLKQAGIADHDPLPYDVLNHVAADWSEACAISCRLVADFGIGIAHEAMARFKRDLENGAKFRYPPEALRSIANRMVADTKKAHAKRAGMASAASTETTYESRALRMQRIAEEEEARHAAANAPPAAGTRHGLRLQEAQQAEAERAPPAPVVPATDALPAETDPALLARLRQLTATQRAAANAKGAPAR